MQVSRADARQGTVRRWLIPRSRVGLVAVAVALAALVLPAAASAAHPLAGEVFGAVHDRPNHHLEISGQCNPQGESVIHFEARGTALGPYPGTFTETGTIRIGPHVEPDPFGLGPAGPVLDLDVRFTIQSLALDTTVTGTKDLPGLAIASCAEGGMTVTLPTGHTTQLYEGGRALYLPQSHLTYEARINGPEGTSYQQGTTSMQIAYVLGGSLESGHRPTVGGFGEQFWTSDPAEPPETPGKATGGGQIPGTDPTSPVSFGFEAISDEQADGSFRFQGRCAVEDRARNTSVRCLNVTSYTQVGNHATFRGEAEVNGQRTEYTIDVDDLGEPNSGRDTFKIVAGGYTAGGNVPSGNVQVFAPPGTPQG